MAVLYHVPTSRSLRVLWTLEEIGATVEVKSLGVRPRLQEPEYLAINPAGTLPALIDGDRALYKSLAICEYLAALHGSDLVVAADEPERPRVRAMAVIRRGDLQSAAHPRWRASVVSATRRRRCRPASMPCCPTRATRSRCGQSYSSSGWRVCRLPGGEGAIDRIADNFGRAIRLDNLGKSRHSPRCSVPAPRPSRERLLARPANSSAPRPFPSLGWAGYPPRRLRVINGPDSPEIRLRAPPRQNGLSPTLAMSEMCQKADVISIAIAAAALATYTFEALFDSWLKRLSTEGFVLGLVHEGH